MFHHISTIILTLYILTAFAQQASLSGTVTLNNGSTPIESVLVVLENNGTAAGECYTDAGGSYSMSINAGTYSQLRVRNLNREISAVPYVLEHTAFSNVIIVAGANDKDIALPRFYTISGTVFSSGGDTIKGAYIECGKSGGMAPPCDRDSSSLENGVFSLVNTLGNVRIMVYPPAGQGVQQTYFDIELLSDTIWNAVLPRIALVTGAVTNSHGDTLKRIGVTFEKTGQSWQVDSFTNVNGRYSIPLTPGTFAIRIRNGSQMGGPAGGAPAHLEATVVASCSVTKDTTINISMPNYPMVRCSVVTASGAPAAEVVVESSTGPMPGSPLGDLDTTGSSGLCTLFVDAAQKNDLWIHPPSLSDAIATRDSMLTAHDTTIIIRLISGIVLSGTVFRSDSATPVAGIGIAIEFGSEQLMVYTDASGTYSQQLAPGTYRLRVRSAGMSTPPVGIPQSLEHTVFEQINLTESRTVNIRLPYFPTVSGKVYNAAGTLITGAALRFVRWNGSEAPPYCEGTTDAQGAYSIVIGSGVNKVKLTPPGGSLLGTIEFIESFDSSVVKDIYLPDQAKGITRVQPSVITRGEAGRILINGINIALNLVTAPSQVSFGEGVTVDSVRSISAITLYAYVKIDAAAKSGTRDIRVTAPGTECFGPNLLTITAPAEVKIELDNNGKTVDTVVIGDGTGTELTIPAGTPVTLPPNSDSVVSYKAPILEAASTGKPPQGEFTQVQRELSPAGLAFGDTVVIKCQYTKQDVEGVNEATIKPYFYVESANGGAGASGDEIAVLSRDTVANTVSMVIPHFSMFRLAGSGGSVVVGTGRQLLSVVSTGLAVNSKSLHRQTMITLYIAPEDALNSIRLEVIDLKGRVIRTMLNGTIGVGNHTLLLDRSKSIPGGGMYFVILRTRGKTISRTLTLF